MSYTPWWDAGFEALVSIIPPEAAIAPNSTITDKARGKAPGLPTRHGWVGYDWIHRAPSRDNVEAWKGTGAGLGLRTDDFPAVDIDVLDPGLAEAIETRVVEILGPAPCRTGRAPKRLLLYRTETPSPKRRLAWTIDGETHAVEVLGQGSQCVVEGTHATTGTPYTWTPIHPTVFGADLLTTVTPEQIDQLFEDLTAYLSMFGHLTRESCESATSRQDTPQSDLTGDPETVAQVVRSLPNTAEMTREDYLRVGYAIKAALPASQDDAYDLWAEWAARWEGGVNEAATIESDWRRMKGPFELGARYLYDLAAQHGDHRLIEAAFTFDEAPAPANVSEKTTIVSDTETGVIRFSDAWLAHRLIEQHGQEMRYCPHLGGWMYWDGTRWVLDELARVGSWAARVGRDAAAVALERGETPSDARSTSRWCNSERAVKQMLAYASRHPLIAVRVEAFDADPWVLNTPNGVVNLRNGVFSAHTTPFMVAKCTHISPSANIPQRWLEFLAEVTGGDTDLQAYLQRLFGYALTGVTEEEMLAFFWGTGGNGKSTLLKTISNILGSYATTASMETFTASRFDRHPADLAALAGARLVIAQETQEGRDWDEAKIKSLTGGDPITARFMRQNFFTYQPQFKLVFAGNHRPSLISPDAAMSRRFHLVPFHQVPAIVDTHLKDRLVEEYAGILGWMIEGCRLWARDGLMPPLAVVDSTQEYFEEADPLGRWIDERCDRLVGATTLTTDLFADYRNWCTIDGEDSGTLNAFSREIKRRGFLAWRHPQTRSRGFLGIQIRAIAPDARTAMLAGEVPPPAVVLH